MKPVLRFVPHHRLRTVKHRRRHLLAAMGGQAMHENRIPGGGFHQRLIDTIGREARVPLAVTTFVFLYFAAFAVLAIALRLTGLDLITAISGAGSAISNVGPGLGAHIGPAGTYQPLPDSAKWLLSAGMLLGRLELFTALVLFLPRFWRS